MNQTKFNRLSKSLFRLLTIAGSIPFLIIAFTYLGLIAFFSIDGFTYLEKFCGCILLATYVICLRHSYVSIVERDIEIQAVLKQNELIKKQFLEKLIQEDRNLD